MKTVICSGCGKTVRYSDESVIEGCRDFENVVCPNCKYIIARVFTNGHPNPHIIEDNNP